MPTYFSFFWTRVWNCLCFIVQTHILHTNTRKRKGKKTELPPRWKWFQRHQQSQKPLTSHLIQHRALMLFPGRAATPYSYHFCSLCCCCQSSWMWQRDRLTMENIWHPQSCTHSLQRGLILRILTLTCWLWQTAKEFILKEIMLYSYGKSLFSLKTESCKEICSVLIHVL